MSENTDRHEVIIGGTGGQGVITIGYVMAQAAYEAYKYVTRFPIYMATMRGGAALCTVIFSNEEIASPILSQFDHAITMENGTFGRFEGGINSGGKLIYNSSIVNLDDEKKEKMDCKLFDVPVTELARDMGAPYMANMVMLGAYREIMGVLSEDLVKDAMKYILTSDGKEDRLDINLKAYDEGAAYVKKQGWS